jgi:transposase InsO family protein
LLLRAKTGWSAAETARRFLLTPKTVQSWARRCDEQGPDALVRVPVPVNRYPDFVTLLVQKLHRACPEVGRRRLADTFGRAGLALAPSTVKRMKDRALANAPRPTPPPATLDESTDAATGTSKSTAKRVVSAKRPHELWHCDITTMPTAAGYWVAWWPLSIILKWALSWHIALVLDHFSRALLAFGVFKQEPTGKQICSLLARATCCAGRSPRYIVTDHGTQFSSEYRDWCKKRGIRPRFGAIGKHGSIAVLERMIRSLKDECLRKVLVPFSASRMRAELEAYRVWYNTARPHSTLTGATPAERLAGRQQKRGCFEPRALVPLAPGTKRVDKLELVVTHLRNRPHLPLIQLREAA